MNLGLKDKRVVITAAGKGLGKASALRFLEEGCKVCIGSRTEASLRETAEELNAVSPGNIYWQVCDLDDPSSVDSFLRFAAQSLGGIDILVNNCGGPRAGYFEEFTEADWQSAFRQVLLSAIQCTKFVLPGMKEQRWGRIINITSASTKQPIDNLILSTSFRTGLHGLMKTISSQYGHLNITCNNVAPGYILTDRLIHLAQKRAETEKRTYGEVLDDMAVDTALKRLGRPEEISGTIAFLASEPAGYITGKTLVVDGGKNKGLD